MLFATLRTMNWNAILQFGRAELELFRVKASWILLCSSILLSSCDVSDKSPEPTRKKTDYIKKIEGRNDSIPAEDARRGEVLIAYSDCKQCHTREKRAKGPAFEDIAEKYPANEVFIKMLAQKIIHGGYGTWGRPVMDPHPHLSVEDAELMVKYILSLKNL